MIELKNVSKYYNTNGVTSIGLEHINLSFNKGDIVAITGESGSGKSTLLNVICANDSYDDGEIYFYGNETSYFDLNDQDNFRNEHVGFIYQNYNIIDSYTVLQNVMFPLLVKGYTTKEAKEKALGLIAKVGLSARAKHRGTKLSGGEKQRVVIARALASDPEILACDEPTGNLDSQTAKEIIALIKEVAKDKLVLIVTHNYEQVASIATRKVTLVDGQVIEDKILQEVPEDEPKPLVLQEQKINCKHVVMFTKNNVFSTPKKTFFSFIVLFFMFFCILSMFQGLNYSYDSAYNYYPGVAYYGDDYVVFKKQDGFITAIDQTELNKLNLNINYYNYATTQLIATDYIQSYYMPYIPNFTNLLGRQPVKENECLLLLPYYNNYYASFLNTEIQMGFSNLKFKIVGIAQGENITSYCICTKDNYSFSLLESSYSNRDLTAYLGTNNMKLDINVDSGRVYSALYLPYGYQDTEVTLSFGNKCFFTPQYEIIYGDYEPYFELASNFTFADIPVFEAGVYTDDASSVIKTLENLGYVTYYPYEMREIQAGSFLTLIFLTILCVIPTFFLYLISYLIYRTIFSSKFKEYTIMRIIGINKKNMSKMIILEIFVTTIFSALITFLFGLVLGLGFGIKLYSVINAYISVIFVILALLFSVVLAFKTNNRLFAKSTAKMLKGGE